MRTLSCTLKQDVEKTENFRRTHTMYGCRKHITAQQILKHWNGKKTFNFFKSLLVACLMVIYSALFAWLFILFSLRSSLLPSTLFFFHHFSPFSDVESCQIGASGWNIVLRRRNSSFVSFLSLSRLGRDDKCWLNITRDMNVNSSDKFLALKFVLFYFFFACYRDVYGEYLCEIWAIQSLLLSLHKRCRVDERKRQNFWLWDSDWWR